MRTPLDARRAALSLLSLAALASCRYPSTSVLFVLGSDAPSSRELRVEARLWRTDEPEPVLATAFSRTGLPAAGEALFTAVPRGEPRSQAVTLKITATLASSPTEPTQVLRRTLRFSFRPNATLYQRVFFAMACLNRSNDCARNATSCTVQEACEERGQTCGDNGQCVNIDVVPEPLPAGADPRDASLPFDDATSRPSMDSAMDAADVGGDALEEVVERADAAMDATDAMDARDAMDATDATDARDASDAADVRDVADVVDSGVALPSRIGVAGAVAAGIGAVSCAGSSPSRNVFCWGDGSNGMNMLGAGDSFGVPQLALSGQLYDSVALGETHSCALALDRSARVLSCFGESDLGQCGVVASSVLRANVVGAPGAFVQVSAGRQFTCALDGMNDVYCWGRNELGQLGIGARSSTPQPTPQRVFRTWDGPVTVRTLQSERFSSCVHLSDGRVHCWGERFGDRPSVLPLMGALSFSLGERHACFTVASGDLFCYGDNDVGQLGDGTNINSISPVLVPIGRVSDVSITGSTSCAVTTPAGAVYCWGDNESGKLGDGSGGPSRATPTRVSVGFTVRSVTVGGSHVCALGASGELACWGSNSAGQVGSGSASLVEPLPQRVSGT